MYNFPTLSKRVGVLGQKQLEQFKENHPFASAIHFWGNTSHLNKKAFWI